MTEVLESFIAARRAYVALRRAEKRLYYVVQSKFPKNHPLFKSVVKFCPNDSIRRARYYSDEAICKTADLIGDDIFRDVVVDGVHIPAVTHFFYGLTNLEPDEKIAWSRTRKLTTPDLQLFEQVYCLGRTFMETASVLQKVSKTAFMRESLKFEKSFKNVQSQIARSSALYTGYLCLSSRLPQCVARHILTFYD